MSDADTQLRALAGAHGIYLDFHDLHGDRHEANPDTLRALLRALNVPAETEAEVSDALAETSTSEQALPQEQICLAGEACSFAVQQQTEWTLLDEAGAVVSEGRDATKLTLPGLAVGYYRLVATSGGLEGETLILCRPRHAPAVDGRVWGTTGALYGLRSGTNGGLGNYRDLGAVCDTLGRAGAQFFGVNPIAAMGWMMHDIISPYSPSHRGVFNPDHIALPDGMGPTPEASLIDYATYRTLHRAALEAAFQSQGASDAFLAWAKTCSPDLRRFAEYEAISERHGADFTKWSKTLRQPGAAAAKAAGDRAQFHLWLQWQADTQVAAAQRRAVDAGMSLGLYLDLAVGPRPDGAEVWMNGDTIAKGVTIGAPPDQLSPEGQSWALAAHAPELLAKAQYTPLRRMLRTLMSHCGLLRIDHALGLLRSFWIPDDGSPGGYITQPLDALLAVITIEAHRAGCVVVGEDLGLVPDGFREAMNDAGLYSYAVWQFEANHMGEILPASALPSHSLACFSTHDTPTMAGFWHGTDIEWWREVGWISDRERQRRHTERAQQRGSLRKVAHLDSDLRYPDIANTLQSELAQSPAALVSVQLDDIFGEVDAQNLPGTINEHPNWRRRLSVPIEDMATSPDLTRLSDTLNTHRAAPTRPAAHPLPEEETV